MNDSSTLVNDYNKDENRDLFVVPRIFPKYSSNKFLRYINKFGRSGGFNFILEALERDDIEIEVVSSFA